MACKRITVDRYKLCSGDLRHRITLLRRDAGYTPIGESEPVLTFATIAEKWAAIKTVEGVGDGVSRMHGINIEDGTTHLVYIRRDKSIEPLNTNETFVAFEGRYLKVLREDRLNEGPGVTMLQCSDRGDDTSEASQA